MVTIRQVRRGGTMELDQEISVESKSERMHRSKYARLRRRIKRNILNGVTLRRYAKGRRLRRNK